MKTEEEIREKMKEAYRLNENETHEPNREFFNEVALILGWVLDEDDDPLMDY